MYALKSDKENAKKTENTFELFTAGPNQANWLPTWFRTPIDCRPDFRQFSTHTFTSEYDSFSDVGEIRVYFASKILTPCRMH